MKGSRPSVVTPGEGVARGERLWVGCAKIWRDARGVSTFRAHGQREALTSGCEWVDVIKVSIPSTRADCTLGCGLLLVSVSRR